MNFSIIVLSINYRINEWYYNYYLIYLLIYHFFIISIITSSCLPFNFLKSKILVFGCEGLTDEAMYKKLLEEGLKKIKWIWQKKQLFGSEKILE